MWIECLFLQFFSMRSEYIFWVKYYAVEFYCFEFDSECICRLVKGGFGGVFDRAIVTYIIKRSWLDNELDKTGITGFFHSSNSLSKTEAYSY